MRKRELWTHSWIMMPRQMTSFYNPSVNFRLLLPEFKERTDGNNHFFQKLIAKSVYYCYAACIQGPVAT